MKVLADIKTYQLSLVQAPLIDLSVNPQVITVHLYAVLLGRTELPDVVSGY